MHIRSQSRRCGPDGLLHKAVRCLPTTLALGVDPFRYVIYGYLRSSHHHFCGDFILLPLLIGKINVRLSLVEVDITIRIHRICL